MTKHFLDVSDYSPSEIQDILDLAIKLKKEYFAGGPNSMRGWRLRQLGPGSVIKDFNGISGTPERYGDVQL